MELTPDDRIVFLIGSLAVNRTIFNTIIIQRILRFVNTVRD